MLTSGEVIHLDLAWPGIRLAVEPGHSWWHGGHAGQRRNMARDHGCAEQGWLVVRFDEVDVGDRLELGRRLTAIYRQRVATFPTRTPTPTPVSAASVPATGPGSVAPP